MKNFSILSIKFFCLFMFFTIFMHAQTSAHLKVLSWNIGQLPYIEQIKNKTERINSISNALTTQKTYDIIIFQESFTNRSRKIIENKLHDNYPYSYGPICSTLKFNSGLWILSKIPLEMKKEIIFRNSKGFDFLARKGSALFIGEFNNVKFQLVVTHLQDDNYPQSIRNKQIKQIYNQLLIVYSDPDIPQIICGDFNINQENKNDYNDLITNLDAQNDTICGKFTFDDEKNDVYKSHNNPRIIDYVLIRNSQFIGTIKRDIITLKNKWKKGYYLSDHNAIEADIEFYTIKSYVNNLKKYEN